MPLEIRELVIKATVGNNLQGTSATRDNAGPNDAKEADVNFIVEKVMEILDETAER
ncbi:MAG TPA: DUF5908 family protein [Nitrospira sp.]|nr:DUF5908 family protein [Nitrospira sp.]HNA25802.1 DUF5908 family protein [Nitrospira sp.]HNI66931.1 DUF5908 family protein [Nitrospira sp.]HNK13025.1 DUF5908 family protein [Nitrospira sp.]HNL87532.1 DUF5908 family protein [Nitrospira sp.]